MCFMLISCGSCKMIYNCKPNLQPHSKYNKIKLQIILDLVLNLEFLEKKDKNVKINQIY